MKKNTYGKFASAEELLRGYNTLQQAFTQKCQQVAALSKQVADFERQGRIDGGLTYPSLSQTETNITLDNASPQQCGISGLSSNDGTNVTPSPAETVDSIDNNAEQFNFIPSVYVDETTKLGTQTSNVGTGTNGTSPSMRNAEPECQSGVERGVGLHAATQAVLKDVDGAAVPVSDLSQNNDLHRQSNMIAAENAMEADMCTNNDVNQQVSNVSDNGNVNEKTHTYKEIREQTGHITGNDDGAESTQNGTIVDKQKASDDLARAQQLLAGNEQLVKQILAGCTHLSPPVVMGSGGNLSLAMPSRPKTLREASELAKKIFD